jgi:peptidoglycan L-alanyl-D-glutamate endopeptidase CwlK
MKQAATDLNVPIVWGGDWKSFRDGPHFELNRSKYP